jgi:hypothetical protein
MKRHLLVFASVAVLAAASGTAFAQSERAGPGPGAGEGRGAPSLSPGAGGSKSEGAGGRMDKAPAADRDSKGPGKSDALDRSGPPDKPGKAAKSDDNGMKGESKRNAADNGHQGRDGKSAATGKSEGTEGRGTNDKDMKGAGNKHDRADSPRQGADDKSAATGKSEGTEGRGGEHPESLSKLSGEQRTKVQSSFRSHKSDAVINHLDVRINVGVALPRTVTLYAVPEDVVVIVPDYRRYRYFIYDDKVVIVDPDTYEIVDILVLA